MSIRINRKAGIWGVLAVAALLTGLKAWGASAGYCLRFDGTNGYVTVAHNSSLNAYPITVSAWFRTTSTSSVAQSLASKYADATGNGWALILQNGNLRGFYYRTFSNFAIDATSVSSVADGFWHCAALVIDVNGGKLYLDGNVVGSDLGSSVAVDPAAVPGYQSRAKDKDRANAGAAAQSVAIADTAQPKLCPDPGPDTPGWPKRSEQSLAYQEQISGLPRGTAVDLNGVSFDGCRQEGDTFTMLDAKGQGYLWAMQSDGSFRRFYTGIEKLMDQADRQVRAAGGRSIEWYFAEKQVADYMREALAETHPTIKVIWQPPLSDRTP